MRNKIVSAGLAVAMLAMTSGLPEVHAASVKTNSISIIPTITSVALVNGQLVATGTVTAMVNGRNVTVPFSSPLEVTPSPNAQDPSCPVLDLRLGPINLDLLGLVVQTSPICLTITGLSGGGILGNLLCGLANALNNATGLTAALGNLNAGQLTTLLNGLTSILNGALENLANATLRSIELVDSHHSCAILHLDLGPLNLTLLGLNVVLDNCANGAITVDITGLTGQGPHLLGNLLCQLLGGNLINVGATLQDIINQILGLLNL